MAPTRDEHVYKTEGIVLRHANTGEADRIITLFTPFRGKVRALAKGTRRPTSKMTGHLELFTHTSVMIARARNLDIMTQAQTVRSFIEVRESLRLMLYASYAVELVERSTEWESENRALYDLLYRMLDQLPKAQRLEPTLRAFELETLDVLGYRPRLDVCAICGGPLPATGNSFSSAAGGIVCPEDRFREADQRSIMPATLDALRRLQVGGLVSAGAMTWASADVRTEAESILAEYISTRLEHDMNSATVLRALRRQMTAPGATVGAASNGTRMDAERADHRG